MKLLGIDYGKKRIGLAVGNIITLTSTPIETYTRTKKIEEDVQHLKNLIEEYEITKIVIGLPLNMDGTKSKTTRQVQSFAAIIRKSVEIPLEFYDERLTSFEADEKLKEFENRSYKIRKENLDSVSAMVLLEKYMDNS